MNAPKLRFNEFNDSYDEECLSEYLSEQKDRNKNQEYKKEDVLSVSGEFGVINQIQYMGKSMVGADLSNYHIVYPNNIVYTKSPLKLNPFGIIKHNAGKTGIVSTLYAIYECNDKVIAPYVDYYFGYDDRLNRYLKPLVNIGAKHDMKINNDDVLNGIVCFPPSIEEQQKIAAFLSLYDDKINTQITKIEAMENRKSGLLQKIFSQEIRFKAEDGTDFPAWEDVLLEEILVEYKEKNKNDGKYEHVSLTKEGVVPKTERYNRDHLVTKDDKEYRVTHLNDICYNPANLKFGVICRNKYGDSIFSPIYVTFKVNEEYSPSFMEYLLIRPDFINYSLQFQEGSIYERMAVKPESLLAIAVSVPSLPEQKKIARFMELIDQQIQTEKDKLEAIKKVKKGLLQQMFV